MDIGHKNNVQSQFVCSIIDEKTKDMVWLLEPDDEGIDKLLCDVLDRPCRLVFTPLLTQKDLGKSSFVNVILKIVVNRIFLRTTPNLMKIKDETSNQEIVEMVLSVVE